MRDDLGEADYAALAELRHLLRRFMAFSEARARACGLLPQQHQLLLAIRGADREPTVGYLAERLVIRPHSAVELVDRMERDGLVRRVRTPDDLRRARVELTRRGAAVLRDRSLEHREELRRAGPALVEALAAVTGTRAARVAR